MCNCKKSKFKVYYEASVPRMGINIPKMSVVEATDIEDAIDKVSYSGSNLIFNVLDVVEA